MQEYKYKAKTKDGELLSGIVEAESESAAAKVLTTKGLFPISFNTKEKTSFTFFNRVPTKEKVVFIRQLATTIGAGLPISQALRTIQKQITNTSLKSIIDSVVRDVEGGTPLSAALSVFADTFNQIDITLIAAGETSGTLDKVLLRLADTVEGDYKIKQKIRGAMVYPAFVMVVVIGMVVGMAYFVMPQMEGLFNSFHAQLPLITRIVMGASKGITNYGIFILIGLIVLGFILRFYVRTPDGRYLWDRLKLNIPILKDFLKKIYASRFSRTLSGLVSSGVSLVEALNIVSKAIGNKLYEDALKNAAEKVKTGVALSSPIEKSGLFDPIVSQMIHVGEETGEMDNMLTNLANYYDDEVDTFVKSMTSVLEPILIVIMGGFVAVILIAVMLPIYSIGSVIK